MNVNNAIVAVQHLVQEARQRFDAVSVDRSVTFEREASFAVQIITGSEFALKTAMSNPQSVQNAVANVSAIGLTLNPAKRQAYLVPRDGKICLDIGYIGLLDMAIEDGGIQWGQGELVHEADRFALNGVDKPPTHERDPFSKDRGSVIGAYVVVKTSGGDYLTTCMSADELMSIRDRSSAWKNGQKGPWKTDAGEMMKKTVFKRAYKLWPKSERVDRAVHYLNTEGDEGLPAIDGDVLDQPRNLGLTVERAKVVRAVARECLQKFNEGDEWACYESASSIDDNEEKLMLWSILKPHSAVRSCIKRLAEAEHAKQAKLEAPAT